MKYIKTFEEIDNTDKFDDFKIGDYVIIINPYGSYLKDDNFNLYDKCKIISIREDDPYIEIQNIINRSIANYHHSRIVPEAEYYANKYNL